MVSLWYFHGAELSIMIEVLRSVSKEQTDKNYKVDGEMVRANVDLSL